MWIWHFLVALRPGDIASPGEFLSLSNSVRVMKDAGRRRYRLRPAQVMLFFAVRIYFLLNVTGSAKI